MNCALYHANAGKMDALKARFRDYVDRPEELDRESLSQTDSLQSTPERRALRCLGATRAIHAGAARRIQIAAPIAGINTNCSNEEMIYVAPLLSSHHRVPSSGRAPGLDR